MGILSSIFQTPLGSVLLIGSAFFTINAAGVRADLRAFRAMQRAKRAHEMAVMNAQKKEKAKRLLAKLNDRSGAIAQNTIAQNSVTKTPNVSDRTTTTSTTSTDAATPPRPTTTTTTPKSQTQE